MKKKAKLKVKVTLQGCDDHTDMILEITEQEFKFLQTLQEASGLKSTHSCMPVLNVKIAGEGKKEEIFDFNHLQQWLEHDSFKQHKEPRETGEPE